MRDDGQQVEQKVEQEVGPPGALRRAAFVLAYLAGFGLTVVLSLPTFSTLP